MKGIIIFVVCLAGLYFLLITMSRSGWGYPGYYGYHRGPSFWYFGGPRYYMNPSVRGGSRGGPSHMGGGIHGGK